jgi:peptidoglycan-associated lipoprotein
MVSMKQSGFQAIMWIAGISLLLTFNGCGKTTSSSVQDQSLVPGQTKTQPETKTAERPAETVTPPGQPEERVAEPSPPAQRSETETAAGVREQPPAAPPGGTMTLSDVFFDFDEAAIREDAKPLLENNARLLKAEKSGKLVVEGHCDERGTLEYNLVLGERRARAVQQYLVDLGVASSRIQVTSFGKERPFCSEHNQECWQKNRRAHFSLP